MQYLTLARICAAVGGASRAAHTAGGLLASSSAYHSPRRVLAMASAAGVHVGVKWGGGAAGEAAEEEEEELLLLLLLLLLSPSLAFFTGGGRLARACSREHMRAVAAACSCSAWEAGRVAGRPLSSSTSPAS